MKYTDDEALQEIFKRGRQIKKKKDKQLTGILSTATVLSAFLLILSVSLFTGNAFFGAHSVYGSFLLPTEVFGYVLVALIAFVGGVVITVCMKKVGKDGGKDDGDDDS